MPVLRIARYAAWIDGINLHDMWRDRFGAGVSADGRIVASIGPHVFRFVWTVRDDDAAVVTMPEDA